MREEFRNDEKNMESEGSWYLSEPFESSGFQKAQETSGIDGWGSFKRAVIAFLAMLGAAVLIFGGLAIKLMI